MNGTVDEFGRSLVTLTIRANRDAKPTVIQAWIDTAFNGELVIPRRMIEAAQSRSWKVKPESSSGNRNPFRI